MKRFSIFVLTGIGALGVMVFVKWHPVAIVNGSTVWYDTWNNDAQGMGQAMAVQARSTGTRYPDASMISVLRRDSLAALIEDKILAQEARKLFPGFDAQSEGKIKDAVVLSGDTEKAAELIYGFNAANFHDFVLLPLSHRGVVRDEFDKRHINMSAWLAGIKKKARVMVFLLPYTWEGDDLR